jgi:hypothetical protein
MGEEKKSTNRPGLHSLAWTLVANRHVLRQPATMLWVDHQ